MELIVVAHNIRSTYNVGAILRSCDGFGITEFWATGYTPYPTIPHDSRLSHLRDKLTRQIAKTALGAEETVRVHRADSVVDLLAVFHEQGFTISALEQGVESINLAKYIPPQRLVLLLGEEVRGITPDLLQYCDVMLEIPMKGTKESFNVSVATGIALYALTSVH